MRWRSRDCTYETSAPLPEFTSHTLSPWAYTFAMLQIIYFLIVLIIKLHFSFGKLGSSCSSLWIPHENFNMSSGRYVKSTTPRVPDYDHVNCFLMKSRYNCAHAKPGLSSLDYEFSLRSPTGEQCIVREMFNHTGGIAELSKRIREWSHRHINVTHTNVLFVGSSFLRQVYETIVCRYRSFIQGGFAVVNSPDMSIAAMAKNPTYNMSEMGTLVSMESQRAGCHGSVNHEHFYEPGVEVPPFAHPNCSDDMSMVELPGNLRIFYVFRHFRYKADPVTFFAHLGLNLTEVDVVVTNNAHGENAKLMAHLPTVPIISFGKLLPFMASKQRHSAGRFFGADNVGMVHPPDIHPCMPGIPDDETDVLLFQLAHKLLQVVV